MLASLDSQLHAVDAKIGQKLRRLDLNRDGVLDDLELDAAQARQGGGGGGWGSVAAWLRGLCGVGVARRRLHPRPKQLGPGPPPALPLPVRPCLFP